MGGGSWTADSFKTYCCSTSKAVIEDEFGNIKADLSRLDARQAFRQRYLHEDLNIKSKIRQCCDSDEHPNTVPVILAVDVTGSMGDAAKKCVEELNTIVTDILKDTEDVEFAVMAIGDTAYDEAPIQMSQFESDIRIAEHLDKVYFEGGGGGNNHESYSIAWWAGLKHCDLDCWKRGKKGLIITMGDEPLNPYLDGDHLERFLGDEIETRDIKTDKLYEEVTEKFDVYHLAITTSPSYRWHEHAAHPAWCGPLPEDHYIKTPVSELPQVVSALVRNHAANSGTINIANIHIIEKTVDGETVISW